MNSKNIGKLKLFMMGIESRVAENNDTFKEIVVTYKAGLKEFVGRGTYEEGKIKFNFSGVTKVKTIKEVVNSILEESEKYEAVNFIYRERGTDILITADNKNVTMKNVKVKEEEKETKKIHFTEGTSTLLNRSYYIKVGEADEVLKAIDIMTKDGKIKNDKIRKYNQIDHYVELLDPMFEKLAEKGNVTILDCGCGKSYLSFVLNYYLTEVKKIKCNFMGIDIKESVIETSKAMAESLGYRNMEFYAMDIKEFKSRKKINVVLSLHACDTATDMALAYGIKEEAEAIVAVPCCHKELLSQYSYEPFKNILKYGVLKARMADVLTDGLRGTLLEAKGYDVSIVEYISPLETPKNLMIRALKVKDEDYKAMDNYMSMMAALSVYPALYGFLNEWEYEE